MAWVTPCAHFACGFGHRAKMEIAFTQRRKITSALLARCETVDLIGRALLRTRNREC